MTVAVCATVLSLVSSTLAAYAIQRLRFKGSQYVGLAIYLAYLVPPSILFIPLATMVFQLGCSTARSPSSWCTRPSWCRSAPGC
jgi:multiple sugar transport system permease protein